ncbi:MAG: alanine--tRNA ligase [Acidobacteria bacterium]|nr:MAG: alanine--tRNA ligase [Acidobacteriota bacterium]
MSSYDELKDSQQFACRVIADHARATAFAIADGIVPGNEGRNYVLRKIMRRAIYHGREHLDLKGAFFYKVCDLVVDEMRGAFPELETHREFIGKMVRLEEERFGNTVTIGLAKLGELDLRSLISDENRLFSEIAKLYDTFGTPRDLIRVFLEENGKAFEEDEYNERFDAALQALQQQSGIGKTERKSDVSPVYAALLEQTGANAFHGYETTQIEDAKIIAIFDGDKQIEELKSGDNGSVILDKTPFYAESGGQVGDVGKIASGEFAAKVNDTYSPVPGLIVHKVTVENGLLKIGDLVVATVDVEKRDATRRNHTATHLVHAALKEVLGSHVKQAGSVVAPNYLRFDFSHYQPMTARELQEVEDLVNRYILQNEPVTTNMMSIEEAMRSGAVAMFGEKYGSEVRVLSVGQGTFSKELCGGTHVRATGDIGSFKITSDEAIASGVRRIRAITGFDAFERFREDERLIDRSLEALKTQRDNLPNAIEKLQEEVKRTRREIDDLKLKIATGSIGGASSNGDEARDVSGVKVLAKIVDGLDANGARQLSDTLLARLKSGVVVLGRSEEGKASIIVRVSGDLTEKVKAGNVIKELVGIVGGKGGGRADMAEGGGPEGAKLNDALEASYDVISTFLTK